MSEQRRNQERELAAARDLLSIGAVFLRPQQPFVWASGIKSPIYCDNRLILTAPAVRTRIEQGLADLIREQYPAAQVLMGTATAGIAHAAIAGYLLNLPMGYVRSGKKDHGRGNRIEGKLTPGERVVVVEDLISTGGSCLETVDALRDAGGDVLGIVSVFTYDLAAGLDKLAKADISHYSLSRFDAVCKAAAQDGYITQEDALRLQRFQADPYDESWIVSGKNV